MPTIKIRKYGNSVYAIYSHKNQKLKVFTGAKVEDQYWNLSSPKKNCPNLEVITRQITATQERLINASMKVRNMGIDPTVERVRIEFKSQIVAVKDEKPFWQLYNDFLDAKHYKPTTRAKAEVFKKNLEFYCTQVNYKFDIHTWDRVRFGLFVQYLLLIQKMADSTIQRLVKGLKTFLKFVYPDADLSWMKYKLLSTIEEEVIALTEGELNQLIDADLGGYMEKARDLFVFLATTGMRYSDSQLFQTNWITEEQRLEFRQLKTGGKAYPPLYNASRLVLSRYDGIPPQISNQKFNEHLKELFEEMGLSRAVTKHVVRNRVVFQEVKPLYSVISSHTARRTFISICIRKGVPLQTIMRYSGHSDYKSMLPYIRLDRDALKMDDSKWNI